MLLRLAMATNWTKIIFFLSTCSPILMSNRNIVTFVILFFLCVSPSSLSHSLPLHPSITLHRYLGKVDNTKEWVPPKKEEFAEIVSIMQ